MTEKEMLLKMAELAIKLNEKLEAENAQMKATIVQMQCDTEIDRKMLKDLMEGDSHPK